MAFPNYVGLDYGDETVTSTTEARGITIGTKVFCLTEGYSDTPMLGKLSPPG